VEIKKVFWTIMEIRYFENFRGFLAFKAKFEDVDCIVTIKGHKQMQKRTKF
jgi:hypothetical protein